MCPSLRATPEVRDDRRPGAPAPGSSRPAAAGRSSRPRDPGPGKGPSHVGHHRTRGRGRASPHPVDLSAPCLPGRGGRPGLPDPGVRPCRTPGITDGAARGDAGLAGDRRRRGHDRPGRGGAPRPVQPAGCGRSYGRGKRVRARHRHPLPPSGIGGRPDRHAAGGYVLGRPALRGPRPGGAPMALCRAATGDPGLATAVAVKGGHHLAHDLAAVAKDRIVAGVFRHQPDVVLSPPKRLDHALFPEQSDHDVTVDRVVLLADHQAVAIEDARVDHRVARHPDREHISVTHHVPGQPDGVHCVWIGVHPGSGRDRLEQRHADHVRRTGVGRYSVELWRDAPQAPGFRHDRARHPVTAGQVFLFLQLSDLVFHGGDGLQADCITDFPVTRGDAVAFGVRLDKVQDSLLPFGEPWAGAVIGPWSARHSPSPPLETGFRCTHPRSKMIRTQRRLSSCWRPCAYRNWPGELSVSSFQTTATISVGSMTAQPVSRTRRTMPSSRISTPVSFRFGPVANPIWPLLLTTMKMVPDFPMRGLSRSPITSPVMKHHLQIALRAGCPAPAATAKRSGYGWRMTGSSVRPRRTSPSPWPQRSAEGGTASRMAGKRPCRVVSAIIPSSRASRAPRQWWMPWPKARWLVSARAMSNLSGSSYRAGSRPAAASEMITWARAGMTVPPRVTSPVVYRNVECGTGASQRRISSIARGIRAGSAARASRWSGWVSRAAVPLPIRLVVVSCPATVSWKIVESISCSDSAPSWSAARTRSVTRSSPGAARLTARSPVRYRTMSAEAATASAGGSGADEGASSVVNQLPSWSRSGPGTPSSSLITVNGSGKAKPATRSTTVSLDACRSSSSPSAIAWTRGRRAAIRGRLNAAEASLRSRVWSGGSTLSMCRAKARSEEHT